MEIGNYNYYYIIDRFRGDTSVVFWELRLGNPLDETGTVLACCRHLHETVAALKELVGAPRFNWLRWYRVKSKIIHGYTWVEDPKFHRRNKESLYHLQPGTLPHIAVLQSFGYGGHTVTVQVENGYYRCWVTIRDDVPYEGGSRHDLSTVDEAKRLIHRWNKKHPDLVVETPKFVPVRVRPERVRSPPSTLEHPDPDFSQLRWRRAVSSKSTILGYWDWVNTERQG